MPPNWLAVVLAALSFLVWVYSFGDVFRIATDIWHPLFATLLVLGWTFAMPLVYRRFSAQLS